MAEPQNSTSGGDSQGGALPLTGGYDVTLSKGLGGFSWGGRAAAVAWCTPW